MKTAGVPKVQKSAPPDFQTFELSNIQSSARMVLTAFQTFPRLDLSEAGQATFQPHGFSDFQTSKNSNS
jgi:hypothetical protein